MSVDRGGVGVVVALERRGARLVALVRHICGDARQYDVSDFASAQRWAVRPCPKHARPAGEAPPPARPQDQP
jgi:hypothetical protein